MARDRTIGKAGGIPWHHPGEQRFFKDVTMGTALVMGRRTFESIGRVLPGRDNIVITRDPAGLAKAWPAVFAVSSLNEALETAARRGASTASIAGGGEIYAAALPLADAMILSLVPEEGRGDVFFPQFDPAQWRVVGRERVGDVDVVRYERAGS
jgi:dihydrofolate reductase